MIQLNRADVKPPEDWEQVVAKRFKGTDRYQAFRLVAIQFEALDINDDVRRQGFTMYPCCGLPGKTKKDFPSLWGKAKPALAKMSRRKCAYCEGEINAERSGQVEHFKPKARFPTLAYDWGNYFLACGGCNGAKSDRWPAQGGYLRPDAVDPTVYLVFQADGFVAPVPGHIDAANTVDDFDLNRGWLVSRRRRHVLDVMSRVEGLVQVYQENPQIAMKLVRAEWDRLRNPENGYTAALTQCFRRSWNAKVPSDPI